MQEKFAHANAGDFIVTAQEGHYSLLSIRSLTDKTLLLEEITVPCKQIHLKTIDWKKWAAEEAPGHTSWTLYEIDRTSGELIECFSYSKNGWLYLDSSEQFLPRLMRLPLEWVPSTQRKKIGHKAAGEVDRRSLWNPPLVVEGKKVTKPAFDVFNAHWPDDGSKLATCVIEIYYAKDQPDFPFPYWVEVHSPHYTFKMRTVDSGHHLVSSKNGPMPRKPSVISEITRKRKP